LLEKSKNILVVFSGKLVPIVMMNQNRTINLIKRIATDHKVDLLTSDTNDPEIIKSILPEIDNIFFFTDHKNFGYLRRIFFSIRTYFLIYFLHFPEQYNTIVNKSLRKQLKYLIKENNYNIVLLHYWYLQKILPKKTINAKVIIDTHGLIYEKVLLESYEQNGFIRKMAESYYAKKYKKKELKALNKADLLIFNSEKDRETYIHELNGKVNSISISNGQNVNYFSNDNSFKAEDNILFYGSLGGIQNQVAFEKFWFNIYPLIIDEKPNVNLIVMGNNPPKWISALNSNKITVTGFVEDIRPFLKTSNVCILPLTLGAGFRGRIVEVMAMGVPVVGTHNALDSVNMINGIHGFITDDDREMAKHAVHILNDNELNKRLSENCINFIKDNYSIEATYGRLSDYLLKIK